jgi:hypothetical protein
MNIVRMDNIKKVKTSIKLLILCFLTDSGLSNFNLPVFVLWRCLTTKKIAKRTQAKNNKGAKVANISLFISM